MSDKCPLKKQMSAVTAPQDDVDTNNPNHPMSDTDWPLPSSGFDPGLIPGRSEFESHHGNLFFKRVRRGVRSTARDTTVPKVGKAREPFVYPNQLKIYIRFFCSCSCVQCLEWCNNWHPCCTNFSGGNYDFFTTVSSTVAW